MITNNIFYINLLRELWEIQREEKSVGDFCSENNISKSFFYTHIGSKSEVLTQDKYKREKHKKENAIKYNKFVKIDDDTLKTCRDYFVEGKDFSEISSLTGTNEWMLMQLLIDEWENRQIERNAYCRENLYQMSIKDMFNNGLKDKEIAYMFSVSVGKIKEVREIL